MRAMKVIILSVVLFTGHIMLPRAHANGISILEDSCLLAAFLEKECWGDSLALGKSQSGANDVWAYYYNQGAETGKTALILAGVHGSEFYGVDIAYRVKSQLDSLAEKRHTWSVLIIPELFTDNVREARKKQDKLNYMRCTHVVYDRTLDAYKCTQTDPNRQMPCLDREFKAGMKASNGEDIELENQYLLTLVQSFKPGRIASLHCKHTQRSNEIGVYADPRTFADTKAQGFADDALLALRMAFHIVDHGGTAKGNFISDQPKGYNGKYQARFLNAVYPLDPAFEHKEMPQPRSFQASANKQTPLGVSFGTWASTEILEGDKLIKPAASMITMELPHYDFFQFKDGKKIPAMDIELLKRHTEAYTLSLVSIFLSPK